MTLNLKQRLESYFLARDLREEAEKRVEECVLVGVALSSISYFIPNLLLIGGGIVGLITKNPVYPLAGATASEVMRVNGRSMFRDYIKGMEEGETR